MKTEFKILSLEEEQKLTTQELKGYYIELRNYLAERKLTNTSKLATTIAPKLNYLTRKTAQLFIKMFDVDEIGISCDGIENIPSERVIFVHTNKGPLDRIIWALEIDRHCILFQDKEENEILQLCQLSTGIISQKEDKYDKDNAKLDAIRLLLEGNSINYFIDYPFDPNKENYDFIDIAKKAGVPIIPVLHKYIYNTSYSNDKIREIHSIYGKPIYVEEYDNIDSKIEEYETAISTMKQELSQSTNLTRKRVLNS